MDAGPGEFIEDLWNSCDVLGIFFFYAGLASRVSESHSAESEAGSYLRLIDFCITQLKAQGPSRISDESKEEERRSSESFSVARARVIRRMTLAE